MVTHGATKRKRPAGHGERELSKSNQKKRSVGKSAAAIESRRNKRKKKAMVMGSGYGEETEDEDEDKDGVMGEGDDDGDDDDDDSHSQKQRMMLFEKKLRAIKQQKKSKLEDSTSEFKKKVKAQEETLIKSLQEQRLDIKLDASTFSKAFTALLNDAFSLSFSELLTGSPMNPPDLVQSHELYALQASIKNLSARLLATAQSLQATLTAIADRELTLGKGWEQDGDLSISALREAQQVALLKLAEIISNDGDCKAEGTKEGIEEMTWRYTVKRSKKGIKRLLKNVPVSAIDDVEKW